MGIFMAVPESSCKVPRPVNTIVTDNSKHDPNRYAVCKRVGVKYVADGNSQSKSEKIIGYIWNDVYIPFQRTTPDQMTDMLSYGAAAFVYSLSRDLMSNLLDIYSPKHLYDNSYRHSHDHQTRHYLKQTGHTL